jgi:hypothetical protein
MPARNPDDRVLIARIASAERWGRTGSAENRARATKPARDGLRRRFELEADPHRVLSDVERAARADQLLRAHMLRMSLRAKRARAHARDDIAAADAAEAELAALGGSPT